MVSRRGLRCAGLQPWRSLAVGREIWYASLRNQVIRCGKTWKWALRATAHLLGAAPEVRILGPVLLSPARRRTNSQFLMGAVIAQAIIPRSHPFSRPCPSRCVTYREKAWSSICAAAIMAKFGSWLGKLLHNDRGKARAPLRMTREGAMPRGTGKTRMR